MNEKDKIILEDSINAIVATVPGINTAWELSLALCGSGLKLRQKKALEWVKMIRDNPDIFVENLLKNEDFQDGFVYSLERYILERNEEKRKYFRNIFLGFSSSNDIQNFPLEKFIHVLSQLNDIDIEVMRDIRFDEKEYYQVYKDNKDYRLYNIYNLINSGVLNNDPTPRVGPVDTPFVKISEFGKEFIKYIKDEKR